MIGCYLQFFLDRIRSDDQTSKRVKGAPLSQSASWFKNARGKHLFFPHLTFLSPLIGRWSLLQRQRTSWFCSSRTFWPFSLKPTNQIVPFFVCRAPRLHRDPKKPPKEEGMCPTVRWVNPDPKRLTSRGVWCHRSWHHVAPLPVYGTAVKASAKILGALFKGTDHYLSSI